MMHILLKVKNSAKTSPKNDLKRNQMKNIFYGCVVGSLLYAQTYTRQDINFIVVMLDIYQNNPGMERWKAAKKVLRYLQGMQDYMRTYRRTD